jgi:hypothetical protein
MANSKYTFERSELRTLQNTCKGDNEKFLNLLADMVGQKSEQIEQLKHDLGMAEHKIRKLDNQLSDASWVTNPDRMGGAFTDQEIADSTSWK